MLLYKVSLATKVYHAYVNDVIKEVYFKSSYKFNQLTLFPAII